MMRVDLATKHWAHKKQESSVYFETPEYRDLYSATPVIRPKGALQCVRLGSCLAQAARGEGRDELQFVQIPIS